MTEKRKEGKLYAKANNIMGAIYWRTGKYEKALKYIVIIDLEKDNTRKAKEYLKKAERIHKEIGDKMHIAEDYSAISETYIQEGDYKNAERFARKALKIANETGGKEIKILALRAMDKWGGNIYQ